MATSWHVECHDMVCDLCHNACYCLLHSSLWQQGNLIGLHCHENNAPPAMQSVLNLFLVLSVLEWHPIVKYAVLNILDIIT